MSYIICAEVDLHEEVNASGDRSKVDARCLSERDGYITFDVHGEFASQGEITLALCQTLIAAGFRSFYIRHSY